MGIGLTREEYDEEIQEYEDRLAIKDALLRKILNGLDEIKHADHCTCPFGFGPKSTMYARIRKEINHD